VSPLNEHKDMIAITAYYRREAELKAQVDDLQRQLDNARTDWLCETCDGRECEGQRQSELMFAENESLREKIDDWENAVAHALDHRPDEQHCTCVAPLVGKVKQLEREKALQGLHLATMADVVLGENAEDRSDETLVREVCKMARQNRNLVNVLEALAKGKDVPGVTVAEIAEYAQSAVNAVRKEKP